MKKRIFSLLLVFVMAFTIMPAALAAEPSDSVPDVFQGDGLYITVTPWSIKNNDEGWKLALSLGIGGDSDFYEGYRLVYRTEQEVDEFSYYTGGTNILLNWVDKEGNLMDLSGQNIKPALTYGSDLRFSQGLCAFYDRNTGLLGYLNTQGDVVIEPQFTLAKAFSDGLAYVWAENAQGDTETYFINTSGQRVTSLPDGSYGYYFNCGLVAYKGDLDDGTYFVGYLNKQGRPAITIFNEAGSRYDYDKDLELMLGTTTGDSCFSEDGYAILRDTRGGRPYPAYVIIDTSGNQVGVVDATPPDRVGLIYLCHQVSEGLLAICVGDGISEAKEVFVDVHGSEAFRPNGLSYESYRSFDSGVSANVGGVTEESPQALALDKKGNAVIPALNKFVKTEEYNGEGTYEPGYSGAKLESFHDGVSLMTLTKTVPSGYSYGSVSEYYVLEVHQGTYTGSGTVYNAATGQITQGGGSTTPTQPDGSVPSAWATEQVKTAVSAGIVPETLQSQYTQAITRAEFCALAVDLYETVTGTEITQRVTFTDTTDLNVQKMGALGVVSGVGDGKFAPNGTLTREQAAAMLAKLAEVMEKPMEAKASTFADTASISAWALEAVGKVQGSGVMGGVGGNAFAPQGTYNREQSIVTMLRMYELVK